MKTNGQSLAVLSAILAAILGQLQIALAACTISTQAINFGSYDVLSLTPRDSTGRVTYRCDRRDPITISLDRGGAATFNARRMLKGAEALNYNLFLDAARTLIWGDGSGGTTVHSNPAPPRNQNVTVTVFGRIPAGQDVSAGTYTNTVTATIDF
ncbi:MAG TPA: spore coat U domain-containing protein [Candidatus Acidoferrales bacterium]|nr:spore coat U domain-containing protein [Candidatus Acidoferrales bacterium]